MNGVRVRRRRVAVTAEAASLLAAWPPSPGWVTRAELAAHVETARVQIPEGRSLEQVLGELRRCSWVLRDQGEDGVTRWARTPTGMVQAASILALPTGRERMNSSVTKPSRARH